MSVLISSQDIYVSTQQSGSASAQGSDDGFNRFRIAMNSNPLTTGNNQYGRLSVTQFSAYRNFYYVNEWNNKVWLYFTQSDGQNIAKILELTKGDYSTIGDIAAEFTTQLIAALAQSATFTVKAGTQSPPAGFTKGDSGTGIFGVTLETTNGAAHGITNVRLQCRQYLQDPDIYPISAPNQGLYGFNDSYALLGGKRIGAQEATAVSFTAGNTVVTGELVITGFYPLQRTTTQYLYMSCSENTSNMESQNISAAAAAEDTHIVSSSIIAKIPINDTLIGFQQDQSTPFFVELDNRHISEILFEIKDHHGRTVDMIRPDITTEGNMFSDMVFNWEVYSRGGNPHELQAPVKNYNIEQNTMAVNVRANTGDGF